MAAETTLTSAKAWAPDVVGVPVRDAIPNALILSTSTVAGTVEGDEPSVRAQFIADDEAAVVPEGDPIDESDPALSEVVVQTRKVAQLVRVSREQYGQMNAASLLSESVRRAVTKKSDELYVADPELGLVAAEGAQVGTVDDSLDGLIDLQAAVAAEGAMPTHWIVSPTAWAELRKLKRDDTGSTESLLGVGAADAQRYLLDVPVLVSNAVPELTGILVDQSQIVSAVGQVMVAVSDQAYFASDSVGLRATFRFGWDTPRPERMGTFTIGTAGS